MEGAILERLNKKSLSEEVTFELRPDGGEEVSPF